MPAVPRPCHGRWLRASFCARIIVPAGKVFHPSSTVGAKKAVAAPYYMNSWADDALTAEMKAIEVRKRQADEKMAKFVLPPRRVGKAEDAPPGGSADDSVAADLFGTATYGTESLDATAVDQDAV